MSIAELASRISYSPAYVSRLLRSIGVKVKNGHVNLEELCQAIGAEVLPRKMVRLSSVARRYRISRVTAAAKARQSGLRLYKIARILLVDEQDVGALCEILSKTERRVAAIDDHSFSKIQCLIYSVGFCDICGVRTEIHMPMCTHGFYCNGHCPVCSDEALVELAESWVVKRFDKELKN